MLFLMWTFVDDDVVVVIFEVVFKVVVSGVDVIFNVIFVNAVVVVVVFFVVVAAIAIVFNVVVIDVVFVVFFDVSKGKVLNR